MKNHLFQSSFEGPKIDDAFIFHLKTQVDNNPNRVRIREEYLKALVDYARELIFQQDYSKAKTHLRTADQLIDHLHHLKFPIAVYLLQISELELAMHHTPAARA